jgi:hypothetical protein
VKKFKSEADLKKFALSKGAAIQGGFNSEREVLDVPVARPKQAPKPAPPPPPPPPPAPVVVESDMTVKAMVQQTATLSQLFDELREEIRQAAALHTGPPNEWDFEIERGPDGLIKRISAKAYRPTTH